MNLLYIIYISVFVTDHNHEEAKLLWHLYRGTFYATTCFLLFSMNVYVWRRVGINHILIFELDPRRHLTCSDILELWSIFAVIWSLSFYISLQYYYISFLLLALPLLVIVAIIVYFIMPLPIFHWRSRYWSLKAVVSNSFLKFNETLMTFL